MKRRILSLSFLFLVPLSLHAFVPDLGHLVRHQPMMLRGNPAPFLVEGSIEIDGERAPFTLSWGGGKNGYAVEFKKIPSSWTNAGINSLILFRDGSACILSINKAPHPCSALRFWGDFEFNGSADRVVQTVASLGIASSADLVFRPINSKDEALASRVAKVKPVLKNVQGVFMSVLEFANGNSFIDFDSTTYAPLAARFSVDGTSWDFVGSSDFYYEKEENKNNLIVSKRIEVKEGDKTLAIIRRSPLKRVAQASVPPMPSSRGSASDVPYDRFSEKGRNFLKILFLTH
jgi:hypothetical protein